MGVWAAAPWRPSGLAKNILGIQNSLAAHKLPVVGSPAGLLFFDDMDHDLRDEIEHYTRVSAYHNYTPIRNVIAALEPMRAAIGDDAWTRICRRAASAHAADLRDPINGYISHPPTATETRKDCALFRKAIKDFLRGN